MVFVCLQEVCLQELNNNINACLTNRKDKPPSLRQPHAHSRLFQSFDDDENEDEDDLLNRNFQKRSWAQIKQHLCFRGVFGMTERTLQPGNGAGLGGAFADALI